MTLIYNTFNSPLGEVTIQANEHGLTGLWFEQHTTLPDDLGARSQANNILKTAEAEVTAYFQDSDMTFSVPLAATGTDFQQQVWQALTEIPSGETWSYQDLANHINNPKAVRAVGLANGKNPISVIVPCHRVIGSNGKLTGYAGGVERKAWLLKHEGALAL